MSKKGAFAHNYANYFSKYVTARFGIYCAIPYLINPLLLMTSTRQLPSQRIEENVAEYFKIFTINVPFQTIAGNIKINAILNKCKR